MKMAKKVDFRGSSDKDSFIEERTYKVVKKTEFSLNFLNFKILVDFDNFLLSFYRKQRILFTRPYIHISPANEVNAMMMRIPQVRAPSSLLRVPPCAFAWGNRGLKEGGFFRGGKKLRKGASRLRILSMSALLKHQEIHELQSRFLSLH